MQQSPHTAVLSFPDPMIKEVLRVANSNGYEINTTVADSSSLKNIVEQPHQTPKERMKCMLYSARLGTGFWADPLTHATRLYNQTYRSTIKMIPIWCHLKSTISFAEISMTWP